MFLTGCLEENSHLPAEMKASCKRGGSKGPHSDVPRGHHVYTVGGSAVLPCPALWLGGQGAGFLGDNASLEKQSVRWSHGCREVPRAFLLFLLLRNNSISMPSMASV